MAVKARWRRLKALRLRRDDFPWPHWEIGDDEGTSLLLWPWWPPCTNGEDR